MKRPVFWQEERLRFQELFARYDTSGAGRLQLDDLHNMLEEMLGQVSGAQVLFLHAMLDVNGDGLVTLEEFRSALRQVAEVADGLRSHHDSELEAERRTTMAKLSQAMMKRKVRCRHRPVALFVSLSAGISTNACKCRFSGPASARSVPR